LEKPVYQKKFLEECEKKLNKSMPVYRSSLLVLLKKEVAMPKKRLIILVADFLDYDEEEKKLVGILRDKHEVRLVQIPTMTKQLSGTLLLTDFL
jgi:hypothetical protein